MKATGIVRRVDELGRIVLPVELRRTYNIQTDDKMEVFCDDNGMICLRKHVISPSGDSLRSFKESVLNDRSLVSSRKTINQIMDKIGELEVLLEGRE